jgi:hypothetical protein
MEAKSLHAVLNTLTEHDDFQDAFEKKWQKCWEQGIPTEG